MTFDPNRIYTALLNTGLQNKNQPLYQVIHDLIGLVASISNQTNNIVTTPTKIVQCTACSPGMPGDDGDDGFIGPPGINGVQGIQGPQGIVGPIFFLEDGLDGQDGFNIPVPGPQGNAGNPGINGLNGLIGPPGLDGYDGEDAFTIPGATGPQGPQGPAGTGGGSQPLILLTDQEDIEIPLPQIPSSLSQFLIGNSIFFPLLVTQSINGNIINANAGGGYMPTPISRKNFWGYKDDTTATIFHSGIDCAPLVQSAGGTVTAVVNVAQSVMRGTTIAGNNNVAGFQFATVGQAGMFQHLPEMILNMFTGSDLTTIQIWIGFFDNTTPSVNPGVSHTGVNVGKHAAFRYCPAADSTWVASTGDGTTQNTTTLASIAASTQYKLRISFSDSKSPAFQINDLSVGTAISIATNAGDATPMTFGMYIFNNGAGFTRFLDFVSLYGGYN